MLPRFLLALLILPSLPLLLCSVQLLPFLRASSPRICPLAWPAWPVFLLAFPALRCPAFATPSAVSLPRLWCCLCSGNICVGSGHQQPPVISSWTVRLEDRERAVPSFWPQPCPQLICLGMAAGGGGGGELPWGCRNCTQLTIGPFFWAPSPGAELTKEIPERVPSYRRNC